MKLSHLCVILQILVAAQYVKSEFICQDIYKVVLHERAAISCTHDISFYTVRWYQYGSDEPFLRIDSQRKSGSGFTTGEFDIEADGTMIITEVEIKHEGNYTISALPVDGRGVLQQLQIYVIVPPKDIVIQHCDSSISSKVCDHLPKDELANTVLCIAKDARPAVDITWFRISHDGPQKVNTPDNYTRTLKESTSLYTTQSVLNFDKNLFSLQYFTCLVSGYALKDKTNASILINGNVPYGDGKMEQKYVMEGDTVLLSCPKMSYPLAYAKITMADRREEMWMRINPSSQSDECFGQSICVFPANGLVSLTALNRYQDTSLECIYGNGKSAERHVTNVTVMVIPKASSTVIHGCDSFENCSQSIPFRGRIICSVFGVKPPVSLIMKANERSAGDIEFSEENNIIQKDYDSVTSSTHLSAAYEIQECVDLVKVTCLPSDNELQEYILASQVVLEIEKSTCSSGGHGSIVAVLIVGFVLIVGAAVIFTYMYKKGHLSKDSARCSSQKHDSEEGTAVNTDQTDGAREKTTPTSNDQSEERTTQDDEHKESQAPKNESTEIEKYLQGDLPEDTITAMMKFIATCKKNDGKSYRELADSIIYYFITHEIGSEFVMPMIGYTRLGNKIPYPYFLQSIRDKFEGDRSKNILSPLFKDIVQTATAKAEKCIFTDEVLKDLSNCQELSEIFLSALFLSVQEETIDASTCVDILKESLKRNQITNGDYHRIMNTCCKDGWLTGESVLSIIHRSLHNHLDTETYFLLQMKSLLQDKKINLNQWVDELKLCRREGMVDMDSVYFHVKDFISNNTFGWTKEKWIKLVCELKNENLLGNQKCSNLLQIIVNEHYMTASEMNSILESPTFGLTSVPKKILHKVKFKQHDEHPERYQLVSKQKHDDDE